MLKFRTPEEEQQYFECVDECGDAPYEHDILTGKIRIYDVPYFKYNS